MPETSEDNPCPACDDMDGFTLLACDACGNDGCGLCIGLIASADYLCEQCAAKAIAKVEAEIIEDIELTLGSMDADDECAPITGVVILRMASDAVGRHRMQEYLRASKIAEKLSAEWVT